MSICDAEYNNLIKGIWSIIHIGSKAKKPTCIYSSLPPFFSLTVHIHLSRFLSPYPSRTQTRLIRRRGSRIDTTRRTCPQSIRPTFPPFKDKDEVRRQHRHGVVEQNESNEDADVVATL